MSVHKCKFNGGTNEKHDTYLVIFKVHGSDAIELWPLKYKNIESIANIDTCHKIDNHDEFFNSEELKKTKSQKAQSLSPSSAHSSRCGSISSLIAPTTTFVTSNSLNPETNRSTPLELASLNSDDTDEDYNTDTENEISENITMDMVVEDDGIDASRTNNTHIVVDDDQTIKQQHQRQLSQNTPEIHYFFRPACHIDESYCDSSDSTGADYNLHSHKNEYAQIQSIVLEQPARQIDKCVFQNQEPSGQIFNPSDMAIFMTKPVDSSQRASFAVDLSVSKHDGQDGIKKVGTAYLYLDPKFSTQASQRTPIIGSQNHMPIGQIHIEYLIITNPVGYGVKIQIPKWLNTLNLLAGHRGAGSGRRTDLPDLLLENTVASFNYAHRHGADMCELDVLVSADGVPVVYHDFDVDAVTAQQSSDSLGKFRIQVNEFTVKQLREFSLLSLEDEKGVPYTLNVPNQSESNRPFPTLAEVLDKVDQSCGLNIEIKWPQVLESGNTEAKKYREINDFIDRIINVVDRHAKNRRVILESFDADIVIMLRLKQTRFPVFFLNQGMTDRYERYLDPRSRSIRNGIYFSQAFDLAGIDLIVDYYFMSGKKLVHFINSHGLIARAWGPIEFSHSTFSFMKQIGLQCITYDKIDMLPAYDSLIK